MQENNKASTKQLFKILIGAAWIDGTVQAEERVYLEKMATSLDLADDPEVQSLLSASSPVNPEDCYEWLGEYLGAYPTTDDYNRLLEAISAIIYSDDNVDTEEAKLLTRLQIMAPTDEPAPSAFGKLLKSINSLYRHRQPKTGG